MTTENNTTLELSTQNTTPKNNNENTLQTPRDAQKEDENGQLCFNF